LRNTEKKSDGKSIAYVERVNRAVDFVLQNLDQPLKLEVVARAACFSPFHFHRIFRLLVGESLAEFVKRVRLERAIALLSRQDWATRRRPSLTDIALACGFASSSDFTRCFKQRYGVPPSRFDVASFREKRREEWQRAVADPQKRNLLERLKPGANPDGFAVRLRRLPPRSVAYVRVQDAFRAGAVPRAAGQLLQWAEARGLADGQWLGYMWDDPEIVAIQDCRYDVGLEVPAATPRGEVGRFEFPAMQVAEIEIRGGIDLEMRALDWLFGTWLPASGFVPTEQPCFEAWIGRPFAHGTERFELLLQLPVERG
jgi:AraC family transcriptional regulator